MSEVRTCGRCGAEISAETAGGLCPRCLMAMNFESRTMPEGEEAPKVAPLTPEEMREHFPQFEILECLGRGGMGVVYKARQKALDREVAIKVLAGEWQGDPGFAARFEREAKTLAQMSHPNIVTVHDFGEADGLFHIVMEFVDGVNLRDLLREGKMEPEQALAIVPPVCEALEYAHGKGVVHRDIKPENLLLDRNGRIKIADFGIASLVGATGEKSGTPAYMAPEQKNGRADRRADIYGLGVVLYEMLTGERPARELVAPSRKVQVDVKIDEMVLRALEKEPERRYQTAGEFRTAIETMAPTAMRPGPPPLPETQRSRGMFERWWWMFLVMIPVGAVLGLITGALFSYLAPRKYVASANVMVSTVDESVVKRTDRTTVIGKLESDENLASVSKALELPNRWMLSDDAAIQKLKGSITLQEIQGTDLVAIRVKSTDPQNAADIANALATKFAADLSIRVRIVEQAVRPGKPVSRNRVLILALAPVAGLFVSPLLALVLIAILHKMFPEGGTRANSGGDPAPAADEFSQDELDAMSADPANWRYRFFYLCSGDPRIVVPKRTAGFGWTVNMANRWAIPFVVAVLVGSLALIKLLRDAGLSTALHHLVILAAILLGIVWICHRMSRSPVKRTACPPPHVRTLITTTIALGLMALIWNSAQRRSIYPVISEIEQSLNETRATLDSKTPATMDEVLAVFEEHGEAAAVDAFLKTDWSDRPLFRPGSLLSLTEDQFAALPAAERNTKSAELNLRVGDLRTVTSAVRKAGLDAAAKGDFTRARKCFDSLKRCGRALDVPGGLLLIRAVGQAVEQKADEELANLSGKSADVFGPVIERVVTNLVDLDSGTLMNLPLDVQPGERDPARYSWFNEDPDAFPWMRKHGIDGFVANHGFVGVDLLAVELTSKDWTHITPEELRARLRGLELPNAPPFWNPRKADGIYGFETRSGSVGVIQLDPHVSCGVKIRYKLVHSAEADLRASRQALTADRIKSRSRSSPFGKGIRSHRETWGSHRLLA